MFSRLGADWNGFDTLPVERVIYKEDAPSVALAIFVRWCFQAVLTARLLLAMKVSAQARPSHHPTHGGTNSAKYKAEHIIIPNIEFRSTTLADAIE